VFIARLKRIDSEALVGERGKRKEKKEEVIECTHTKTYLDPNMSEKVLKRKPFRCSVF